MVALPLAVVATILDTVNEALADLDEMSFDDDPASVSNVGGIYGGEYMGPSTDEQNFGMSGGGVGPGMGGHPGMGMGGGLVPAQHLRYEKS